MGRKGWGMATGENPEIALLRAGRPLFPRAALTRGLACGFPTLRPPLVREQVPLPPVCLSRRGPEPSCPHNLTCRASPGWRQESSYTNSKGPAPHHRPLTEGLIRAPPNPPLTPGSPQESLTCPAHSSPSQESFSRCLAAGLVARVTTLTPASTRPPGHPELLEVTARAPPSTLTPPGLEVP